MTEELRAGSPIGDHGLAWIEEPGPDNDIVVSSRVRLARNIQGYSFSSHATGEEREILLDKAREAAAGAGVLDEVDFWEIANLDAFDRLLLLERRLVSKELISGPAGTPRRGAGLALARARALGFMVNEEDHLRLQALRAGFQLSAAWREVDQLDEEMGARLPYAFHHEFGFLTSCPTNVGTGLRASVFIHLPGLVLTRQIRKVLEGMGQLGVTYRGLYGEGSKIVGNLFQISNQTTLGKTEEDLIDQLERLVDRVIGYEKQARSVLLREAPNVLEDKVWRAYGILRHARSLPFEEMMNLLSGIRLGVSLKLLKTPRVEVISRMMIHAQTAHLARAARRRLDETDADAFRARYVREALAARDETRP
ncbi:ATP--guanido phosphotransferase [Candidatus Palauibacter sp.]|uniref:ATP--guanido phosphotransferase n=1 Tax=Candidatus Palauibacter sp. TaxID=3101350 RepID=UPI003AF23638